jgi:hypothetical protein
MKVLESYSIDKDNAIVPRGRVKLAEDGSLVSDGSHFANHLLASRIYWDGNYFTKDDGEAFLDAAAELYSGNGYAGCRLIDEPDAEEYPRMPKLILELDRLARKKPPQE